MKTTETVDALLRPMVEEMGYVLDEVEYQKEQGNWVLTLYLERQDGTSVDMDLSLIHISEPTRPY